MEFSFKEIASVSLILFSVIDMIGNVPVIVDLRKKSGKIQSGKATIVAGILMISFLYLGSSILGLFGIDVNSFAVAGAIIMFIISLEMILGITLFHHDPTESGGASIVPIAFPLIAGAGSITTLLSLRAEYHFVNILVALSLNMIIVYLVLRLTTFFERILGPNGLHILRKFFGIILLAISIKLFLSNTGIEIPK